MSFCFSDFAVKKYMKWDGLQSKVSFEYVFCEDIITLIDKNTATFPCVHSTRIIYISVLQLESKNSVACPPFDIHGRLLHEKVLWRQFGHYLTGLLWPLFHFPAIEIEPEMTCSKAQICPHSNLHRLMSRLL